MNQESTLHNCMGILGIIRGIVEKRSMYRHVSSILCGVSGIAMPHPVCLHFDGSTLKERTG